MGAHAYVYMRKYILLLHIINILLNISNALSKIYNVKNLVCIALHNNIKWNMDMLYECFENKSLIPHIRTRHSNTKKEIIYKI